MSFVAIDLTTKNQFNSLLMPISSEGVPVAPVMSVPQNSQTHKMYVCPGCGNHLSCKYTLDRHRETVCGKPRNVNGKWKCKNCNRRYEFKGSLTRHTKYECKKNPRFRCVFCERKFTQKSSLSRHMKKKHPEKLSTECDCARRCEHRK